MSARVLATTICTVLGAATIADAQEFELSVPDNPELRSTATISGRQLTITDAQGASFRYQRARQFDSPDRRYLGFFSADAQQAIRWPVAGRGAMQIGDASGARWRPSRMLIQRVDPPPRNGGSGPVVRRANRFPARTYVAAAETARDSTTVGYIDAGGMLQLFEGRGSDWTDLRLPLRQELVPGAPLAIMRDPQSRIPLVYSVSWNGELLEILEGRRVRSIAPDLQFVPQTLIQAVDRGRSVQIFAVDRTGLIWNIDLAPSVPLEAIEARSGRYDAGVPLTLLSGAIDELFVVDRGGVLVNYVRDADRWLGPQLIDRGFISGTHLAGAIYDRPGGPRAYVSAVDADGRVALYADQQGRWSPSSSPAAPFVPAAPLAFAASRDSVRLMSMNRVGDWNETQTIGGDWSVQPLIEGFTAGAPIAVTPSGNEAFAVDQLGRLVAATRRRDVWELALVVPGADRVPRLVRRTTTTLQPLPPARVAFENRSNEDVVYRIVDLADPQAQVERRLGPGATATETLPRDSGAVLEEVYAVPLPDGTWAEEVKRLDLPPRPRHTVTVFSERTTYRYVDRRKNKPAGATPNFDRKSLVGLGAFQLPPGELLKDGSRWDLVGEAHAARNPGAAALGGPLPRETVPASP